jgi:PAT family beta-lactamase induction signal transducer AmpG
MSQYGWRIGSAGAGALALVVAARSDWHTAYLACAALGLPAMLTALVALVALVWTVRAGHSGSQAVWSGIVRQTGG